MWTKFIYLGLEEFYMFFIYSRSGKISSTWISPITPPRVVLLRFRSRWSWWKCHPLVTQNIWIMWFNSMLNHIGTRFQRWSRIDLPGGRSLFVCFVWVAAIVNWTVFFVLGSLICKVSGCHIHRIDDSGGDSLGQDPVNTIRCACAEHGNVSTLLLGKIWMIDDWYGW